MTHSRMSLNGKIRKGCKNKPAFKLGRGLGIVPPAPV